MPTKAQVDAWIAGFSPDVDDKTLDELQHYASEGMLTAPPQMCGVSAEVLWSMVAEIKAARSVPEAPTSAEGRKEGRG